MFKRIISLLCAASMLLSTPVALAEETADDSTKLYCLSANQWNSQDKKLYRDKGIELENLDTKATYTWQEGSDEYMIQCDTRHFGEGFKDTDPGNEMQSGQLNNSSGDTTTNGSWMGANDSKGILLFDLQDFYWVSQADIWQWHGQTSGLKDMSVRIGDTPDTLKSVGSGVSFARPDSFENSRDLGYASCTFPATRARYVEITFTIMPLQNKFQQMVPAEAVIFGTKEKPETDEVVEVVEDEGEEALVTTVNDPSISDHDNIIIPLGESKYVTKIEMDQIQSKVSGIESYEIWLSDDGEHWGTVGKAENGDLASTGRNDINFTMPYKSYSKFVKIKVNPMANKNPEVTEIRVFGKDGKEPVNLINEETTYTYWNQNPYRTESDIRVADGQRTVLLDGDEQTTVSTGAKWATIVVDLKKPYQINDIDIYTLSKGNTFTEGCEIKYSYDNEKWFTYGYFVNHNEKDAGGIVKMTAKGLPGKNARFLKIIAQSSTEDMAFSEIKVNGYNVTQATTEEIQQVPIRVDAFKTSICYIDWSTYNPKHTSKYAIYCEKEDFTNVSTLEPVRVIESYEDAFKYQYSRHSILEPQTDYYVAVTAFDEYGNERKDVTTTKIHTSNVIGDRPVDIFNVVCHPNFGEVGTGAVPKYGSNWQDMHAEVIRLYDEIGVIGKTRGWRNQIGAQLFGEAGIPSMTINNMEMDTSKAMGNYLFSTGNEPDGSLKPAKDFYEDVVKMYKELKAKDERFVLCDPVAGSLDWIEKWYQYSPDVKDTFDVFDAHIYMQATREVPEGLTPSVPEGEFIQVTDLRNLMAKYGDGDKPLIATEVGYSTGNLPGYQVVLNYEQHRDYIVRLYLCCLMLDVKEVWYYNFMDDGMDLYNTENNWGLVDYLGVPKPSYYGYYNLGNQMRYTSYEGAMQGMDNPYYGCVFFDESKEKYISAAWDASNNEKVMEFETLSGEDELIDVIGSDGSFSSVQTVDGKGTVRISGTPIYLYSDAGVKATKLSVPFTCDNTKIASVRSTDVDLTITKTAEGAGLSGDVEVKGLPAGWSVVKAGRFEADTESVTVTLHIGETAEETDQSFKLVVKGDNGVDSNISISASVSPAVSYDIGFEPREAGNFDKWYAVCKLTNVVNTPTTVSMAITGAEGISVESMEAQTIENLKPGETQVIKIPITRIENKPGKNTATFLMQANGGKYTIERTVNFSACINDGKTPVLDGIISDGEWDGCDVITPTKNAYPEEDVDFKVYRKWDDQNFYMAVDVTDNVHYQDFSKDQMWQGDSLQFTLDFQRNNGEGCANTDYYELGINMGEGGSIDSWAWYAQLITKVNSPVGGIKGKINRTEDNHTIYEFSVPWNYFYLTDTVPEAGTYIGFAFSINDNDGGKRKMIDYMDGITGKKAPSLFEDMVLVKTTN